MPSLFGLAPGGVYRAAAVTRSAVRSYRTVSTLPARMHGGLFSVALSLGSPQPGITRHRSSLEPGLSSRMQLPAYRRSPNPLAGLRLGPFEHRCNPLTAADAHRFQVVAPAAPLKFVERVGKDAGLLSRRWDGPAICPNRSH
jgi:hypothetical protein